VNHAFVLFHYGIFPQSQKNMEKMGVKLHALATWRDVLEVAKAKKYFDPKTLKAVERFLDDPEGWEP
jgi:orotate phosphoribosyltransferase